MTPHSYTYCPLCGFTLIDDYDHFVRCFIANTQWWAIHFTDTRKARTMSVNLTNKTITDKQIIELFEKHCECRPTDVTRMSHSYDCDTPITNECRIALAAMTSDLRRSLARSRCAAAINKAEWS